MSLVINTNIAALNGQKNLSKTQQAQQTTFQRLSTGLRVNSAKDDAAGLYLAQSQTKDIRGLNIATRNAGDGISMAQTAEGALDQIGKNLQRINELAIQSANGSYNDQARGGLQKEVDELTQEINRIVETTEFNGQKLLSRDSGSATLQIGFRNDDGSRITTGLEGGLAAQGKGAFSFGSSTQTFGSRDMAQAVGQLELARTLLKDDLALNTVLLDSKITLGPTTITQLAETNANGGTEISRDLAEAIGQLGNGQSATVAGMTVTRQAQDSLDTIGQQLKIEFNGNETTINGVWAADTGVLTPGTAITLAHQEALFGNSQAANEVNSQVPLASQYFGTAGGNADPEFAATTALTQFKAFDEGALATLKLNESVSIDGFTYTRVNESGTSDANTLMITSKFGSGQALITDVFDDDEKEFKVTTQDVTNDDLTGLFGSIAKDVGSIGSLLNGDLQGTKVIDISTQEAAQNSINFTREAIDLVSEVRATFGAVMNRFEAVISGNQTYSENLTAARSRIEDADFAVETSNLAKQQVLQQAGVAALGQANASAQVVLGLL